MARRAQSSPLPSPHIQGVPRRDPVHEGSERPRDPEREREILRAVAGESHFEGFALRKKVLLQFGQRLRVESRVLSSCAVPHREQTYVAWPGFVPARATAHLPACCRR